MTQGCSSSRPRSGDEEKSPSANTKIIADAYLFDTKVTREGKFGSMRLEIFDADSVIALSGRAYLGKGALRGRITRDSVKLYFPTSNQYVATSFDELLRSDSCNLSVSRDELLGIFRHRPPTVPSPTAGQFSVIQQSTNDAELVATWCGKVFDLKYYQTSEDWRIGSFTFSDSLGTEIKANRREMRVGVRIKSRQFQVTIPADAERIKP